MKSLLTEHDIYFFKEGTHSRIYRKLGAHIIGKGKEKGVNFAVWAPNAEAVSVIGDFNGWDINRNKLYVRWDGSGIWEGYADSAGKGDLYKFHITSKRYGFKVAKGDPIAFYWEVAPRTASVVWDLDYHWADEDWMKGRHKINALDKPISIYEIHLGSWMRIVEENNRIPCYREIVHPLIRYAKEMGFTHVEFLPIMEHPFYGSWGYQTLGYFSPTSRYGPPQDFMYLVDMLHQAGIGVILDWVPSHFTTDEHGLAFFDGTHLYEHEDPRKGLHPDWNSYIFNYGRNEVRDFLISSALFWLDKYHVDGLRVDAVASMLYLDYSRKEGEWIPNEYGGRENLDAVGFLQRMNETVYQEYPDVQTIAEESTSWPMVSRPVHLGGLGFGMKWNMGWMHDTLDYFSKDPVYRKYHHNQLTFSIWYAFSENFVLPLSHDEVVHGKRSLLSKMSGDDWQKFANLRLMFSYMYAHPGKKLLFMGSEFGQWDEWSHERAIDWHLLDHAPHKGVQSLVRDLNTIYQQEPALHAMDFESSGFEWIDLRNWSESVLVFLRKSGKQEDDILVVLNFTPIPRYNYRIGVPRSGFWAEIYNSDARDYGGSGHGNFGGVEAGKVSSHGQRYSIAMTIPPLAAVFFKKRAVAREKKQSQNI
jgi:1,4-alpha-glucan branching enzyme